MSNAIFGKTMEKLRNRIDVKLVNNEKYYLKCISRPSFMSHKIFDTKLVAIHKSKVALKLQKPVYTGMCILDLRKLLIYEFLTITLKNKYDSKSKLLFTDTDSVTYEMKTEDVYGDFSNDKEMLISVIIELSQNTMIIERNQSLEK